MTTPNLEETRFFSKTLGQSWLFIVLAGVASCWHVNPAAWIADDSYFYLVIGRNIAQLGQQTFSGIIPTNGVHPLWQWVVAAWSILLNWISPSLLSTPHFVVAPAAICLWLYVVVYRRLAFEFGVSAAWALVPLTFVSIFGVLASESHLSLLTFSAFTLSAIRATRSPSLPNMLLLGVMAGMATLARLDNLFAVAAVLVAVAVYTFRRARSIALAPGAVFVTAFGVYVVANLHFFGGAMPVSGWMKSSFPQLVVRGFSGGANPTLGGVSIIWDWVPVVVAALLLTQARGALRSLLLAILVGVALKNFYIVLFSRSHTSWYWYSTIDVFMVSLVLAQAAARTKKIQLPVSLAAAVAGLLLVGMIAKATTWELPSTHPSAQSLRVVKSSTVAGDTVLVGDWPGHLAFFLPDRHIFAADLLTANRKWYRQMRDHGDAFDYLFHTAEKAGSPVTHLLWNGNYWLEISQDERHVAFNDPRRYPAKHIIGNLALSDGPVGIDGRVQIWRVRRGY